VSDDVAIGGNATILPGVKIGAGSLIGAGAVVHRDVPPGVVAAGSPAKVIKKIEELTCHAGLYERPYIWRTPKEEV
jgi:acetyltransferase-like isoleucine patch superfamily enzyme